MYTVQYELWKNELETLRGASALYKCPTKDLAQVGIFLKLRGFNSRLT